MDTLASCNEYELLAHIKTLAVRTENDTVARDIISKMGQDRDEPVHAYSARLKGQARVCQFTVRCQCSICPNHDACVGVDYNDIVVRDQVILGCADHEIKLDCLIEMGHSASLEEVMAFVESNESGQPSLQQLNGGSVAVAPASSFRKQQRGMFKQRTPPTPLLTLTCTHCGQVGHGSSIDERSDNCAAYSQIFTKCGKRGHFAALCRQQSTSGTRHGQRRSQMSPKRENATAAVASRQGRQGRQSLGAPEW